MRGAAILLPMHGIRFAESSERSAVTRVARQLSAGPESLGARVSYAGPPMIVLHDGPTTWLGLAQEPPKEWFLSTAPCALRLRVAPGPRRDRAGSPCSVYLV